MSRTLKALVVMALLAGACSSQDAAVTTTASTTTTAAPATTEATTTTTEAATATAASTTTTEAPASLTSTTTTVVYPPTSTTTTIPADQGIGLQMVDAEVYAGAIPFYLRERVGNLGDIRRGNGLIGVSLWLEPGQPIRTPIAGELTTYELGGTGGGVMGTDNAFSTTPREALIKTEVFSPEGHRLVIRFGGTRSLQFNHGLFIVDQQVGAGEVIARAGADGSILELASVGDFRRNVVVWAEWDTNPAPEFVAEWFPNLTGGAAFPEHLAPRPYKTIGDETVSVVNVMNPALGLRPAVLFLHDAGDGADASMALLEEIDDAVGFSAEWRAVDLADPGTFEVGLHDVACLLRFLRSEAHRYGADPDRVTIVGHGSGGLMAVAAALSPEAVDELPEGLCAYWADPAQLTGGVSVGGFFTTPEALDGLHPAHAAVFDPAAAGGSGWFGFVFSDGDEEADPYATTAVADVLSAAGHEVVVKRAEGAHDDLLNPRHPLHGIPAVRLLEEAVERS